MTIAAVSGIFSATHIDQMDKHNEFSKNSDKNPYLEEITLTI
jgi:hypothetical protein